MICLLDGLAALESESAREKDVDYLLIAKPVVHLTTRGSATTVLLCGRFVGSPH